jgi:tRNA (guanine-N7-)-methyltransferase
MKESARSWSSLLPLMMLFGSSLFITATRSTSSKRGLLFFAEALPKIPQCSTGYFASGNRRIAAFSAPPPAERKLSESHVVSFTTASDESSCTTTTDTSIKSKESYDYDDDDRYSPWNNPGLAERAKSAKRSAFRSRQHVNPLAKKFQQPTTLSEIWPTDVFEDLSKPIFLDIGCSRGGFLLDMAAQRRDDYNYLGLEIRPLVVYHAKERVARHNLQGGLDFVGCNVNVDLERLLTLLDDKSRGDVEMVTIQFPDPHFKARHAKRRVVTPELVTTLARFMPTGATVFLQSDVQTVLDEMRLQFREQFEHFEDSQESVEDYVPENILGVPTEREISVLDKDLPVYRAVFKRTNSAVSDN